MVDGGSRGRIQGSPYLRYRVGPDVPHSGAAIAHSGLKRHCELRPGMLDWSEHPRSPYSTVPYILEYSHISPYGSLTGSDTFNVLNVKQHDPGFLTLKFIWGRQLLTREPFCLRRAVRATVVQVEGCIECSCYIHRSLHVYFALSPRLPPGRAGTRSQGTRRGCAAGCTPQCQWCGRIV